MKRKKIIIIGAGAAGLMAACAASDAGAEAEILEKNEKAGKKIYITGKGRCNFTNACDTADFFDKVTVNPRFLYSAVYDFDQKQMMAFLEANGCPVKVERGNRAFPVSDHASDVTKALTEHLKKNHVKIRLHTAVKRILVQESRAVGVETRGGEKIFCDAVILTGGGLSYPSTGSTGDGYRMAEELGLSIVTPQPSLVPLTSPEPWISEVSGLSLKNVSVRLDPAGDTGRKKPKPLYEGFGEMEFPGDCLTGPIILSASSFADFVRYPEGFILHLDLKPALTAEQLAARIGRDFSGRRREDFATASGALFPGALKRVVPELFLKSEGQEDPDRKAGSVQKKEMERYAEFIKDIPIRITGTKGFSCAIVTRGGVCVKEINPSTMETKKVKNLYLAGELIDVSAQTGGYNLQIAWSTGHLAGICAAQKEGNEYES